MKPVALNQMDALKWEAEPRLERPILIAAFGGWNDAGDAASGAVRYLAAQWHAREFATLDPEEFYDFSEIRPTIRLDDGKTREIEWPTNLFTATGLSGSSDIIFFHGTEPQLKWRTYCEQIFAVCEKFGVERIYSLGALLTDVAHTKPVPVSAASTNPDLIEGYGIDVTQYEGPTGIVGVLTGLAAERGIEATSLWASVPHYVGQTPSPKAMLALTRNLLRLIDGSAELRDLENASDAYEDHINELVAADEEVANYVAQLEDTEEEEPVTGDDIARDVEQFLRDQGK